MSVEEASKVTETPTSAETKGKASVPRNKSGVTSVTSSIFSPTDGTPASATVIEQKLYALIGHGPYQIRVLGCAVLGLTSLLMEMLAYRVIARPVDHWCRPPEDMSYLSADAWKNQSIPVEADGSYSQCTVYITTSTGSAEDRATERCYSWDYDIEDWGDSIVSRFGLVCDRQYLFTVVTIVPALSYAVFVPAAGFAADRFGRRLATTISSCVLLIATVGCSVAVNFAFFLVNRAVVVACGTFSYLTTFVMVYEATGESKRWLFTLLNMAVAVTVAPPFVNILSTQEPSWALAHSIFIVPTAAFAMWCSLLDESPAWLLATLRVKQAESAILVAARLNHVAATCVSAVARATSAYVGLGFASGCMRTAMKIVSSGSLGVIMTYVADLFPAQNRCTGVGLSILVGGTGSVLGISLAKVDTVRPGFLFDVFYAFMMLASVFAVQWLPEALMEKSKSLDGTMSPDERKQALKASLARKGRSRSRPRTDNKKKVEGQPAS
ncbi:hypothetical protein MTO96_022961 [Rhipicephalus appendiculatus]